MTLAQRIKKQYCRPAIFISETEWRQFGGGKLPCHFHVERFIWVDELLPEYRIAIPEDIKAWADDEGAYRLAIGKGIQTRFVTYKPTGRQVYDNTLPPSKAVVFEYELEQYVKAMVNK